MGAIFSLIPAIQLCIMQIVLGYDGCVDLSHQADIRKLDALHRLC